MRFLLLVTTLLFSLPLIAQEKVVQGVVTDKLSGETLPGVQVTYQAGKGTSTDEKGFFSMRLNTAEYTLTFSILGYQNAVQKLVFTEADSVVVNIALRADQHKLETVVVTGSRYEQDIMDVPVSLEIIRPGLIENENTVNMETILEQVPGVTIMDGQISIRGGSGFAYGAGSRVMMLLDGLPLLAGDANEVRWNTLPVENISQVEVMKGPSSVQFGSSALNGVVNIRTAYPTDSVTNKLILYHSIYGNPKRPEIKWWKTSPYYSGTSFLHSRKIKNFDLVLSTNIYSDKRYRELEDEHRGRITAKTRYRSKKVEGLSYGINSNMQI